MAYSQEEMNHMLARAEKYIRTNPYNHGNGMERVTFLQHTKHAEDWAALACYTPGRIVARPYVKPKDPRTPLSMDSLAGVYFHVRQTSLPGGGRGPMERSPFGDTCLLLPVEEYMSVKSHNIYFAEFYCFAWKTDTENKIHYVTLIMCEKDTPYDRYCSHQLPLLDPETNPFVQLHADGTTHAAYGQWIEVFLAGDVRFDSETAEFHPQKYTGQGPRMTPERLLKPPHCAVCNLPGKSSAVKRRLNFVDD